MRILTIGNAALVQRNAVRAQRLTIARHALEDTCFIKENALPNVPNIRILRGGFATIVLRLARNASMKASASLAVRMQWSILMENAHCTVKTDSLNRMAIARCVPKDAKNVGDQSKINARNACKERLSITTTVWMSVRSITRPTKSKECALGASLNVLPRIAQSVIESSA